MKPKKHSYDVFSTEKCGNCPKHIKLNVERRKKGRPLYCYKCWLARSGPLRWKRASR